LPRKWQESERTSETKRGWAHFWKYGTANGQARRRKFMDRNPILWLTSREQWQAKWLWVGVLASVIIEMVMFVDAQDYSTAHVAARMSWGYARRLLTFFIYIWTASQATRFFAEGRRSGFLELLLATPLSVKEIVAGNWRAFLRAFGWPVVLMVVAQLCFAPAIQWSAYRQNATRVAAATKSSGPAAQVQTNSTGGSTSRSTTTATFKMPDIPFWVTWATTFVSMTGFLFNLAAIFWFGAWMGLTSKNGNLAILKTFVFVAVIPWFVISFVGGIITVVTMIPMFTGGRTSSMAWFPFISAGISMVLRVATDIVFIVSSRAKLHGRFRQEAVGATAPAAVAPPVIQPVTV
jgi:hypothetical protein